MSETIDEYVAGDLEDEHGAPLTSMASEQCLIGMLLMHPALVEEVRELVSPREFYDRALGRVFEGLVAEGGFRPENDRIIEWLGGETIEIAGRTGKQLIGYLTSLAIDKEPTHASVLADTIMEVAERRFTQEGQTNLVGLDAWQSKMGLLLFEERETSAPADQYDYLVEDLIPEQELTIIMGPSQAGKSFLTYHLAMCVARGVPFFGRRILNPQPVIWCAYEGGRGARGRMLAYARYFDVKADVPFAALTSPVDLWSKDLNVDELIKEIEGICKVAFAGQKPGAVIIDTHNAATPGASEIDSEVVSKIRDRYKAIIRALECSLIVIGHTNALGKHRGNEQLTNNVETVITVHKKVKVENRVNIQIKDNDDREVRTMEIVKQREGETGPVADFVLHGIETGLKNKFGKVRTSCVVTAPNWTPAEQEASKGSTKTKAAKTLGPIQLAYFNAFWEALQEHGEPAPPALNLPRSVRVVKSALVNRTFTTRYVPSDLSPNSAKSRRQRAETYFQNKGLVRIDNERGIVWFTGRYHADLAHITHPRQRYEDEAPLPEPDTEFPE